MSIENKTYIVKMPNGDKWGVPVSFIASHMARYYWEKHRNEYLTSEDAYADAIKSFEDEYEIEDWAKNNMNWVDVKDHASLISHGECDFQEGWLNGDCEVR